MGEHRSEAHSASSVQSAPSGKRGVQVMVGGAILVPVVVQSMAGSAQGMLSQDSPCCAGPAQMVWGWVRVPMEVVARHVQMPPPAPPGSPGPFGLDDPDRIRGALAVAGFADVAIEDVREPQNVAGAKTLDDAVAFLLVAGPASAALRGAPPELRPRIAESLRSALAPFVTPHGVVMPAAAWIVTASSKA